MKISARFPRLTIGLVFIIILCLGLVGLSLSQGVRYLLRPHRCASIDLPVGLKLVGLAREHGKVYYNLRPRYDFELVETYTVNDDRDASFNAGGRDDTYSYGKCVLPEIGEKLYLREH